MHPDIAPVGVSTVAGLDDYYVHAGKHTLLEAWARGMGCVSCRLWTLLDETQLARGESAADACRYRLFLSHRPSIIERNVGADQTMPWRHLVQSGLTQDLSVPGAPGDVGFNQSRPLQSTTRADSIGILYVSTTAARQRSAMDDWIELDRLTGVQTNVRCPLPPKQYLTINPIDHPAKWTSMVLRNYSILTNPTLRLYLEDACSMEGLDYARMGAVPVEPPLRSAELAERES